MTPSIIYICKQVIPLISSKCKAVKKITDASFSNVRALADEAHAKQRTSQQYSSNYSPEVETEKQFKRKRFGRKGLVCILMRPPLSSRSSIKPCGSKIRACPHSDLGEFLF